MWTVHRGKKPTQDAWNQLFASCRTLLSRLTHISPPTQSMQKLQKAHPPSTEWFREEERSGRQPRQLPASTGGLSRRTRETKPGESPLLGFLFVPPHQRWAPDQPWHLRVWWGLAGAVCPWAGISHTNRSCDVTVVVTCCRWQRFGCSFLLVTVIILKQ